MRDFQRARVYRAEDYIDESRYMILSSIQDCIDYASRIWEDPIFRARFPKSSKARIPTIKASKSECQANAYWPPHEKITIPLRLLYDYWVLHELAHIITEREHETDDETRIKHGPEWCDTMLWLVEKYIGKKMAIDLCEAFLIEGVRFNYRINSPCGITMDKSLPTLATGTEWSTR